MFKKYILSATNDTNLVCYKFEDKKNHSVLFICPGRAEFFLKYKKFITDLINCNLNLDIFYIDHRGQGESDKFGLNFGDVEKFEYYVDDFNIFFKNAISKRYQKKYLLCHSMGCLIALLCQQKYKIIFDYAFYLSPLISLNKMFSISIDEKLLHYLMLFNDGKYVFPFVKSIDEMDFDNNPYTTSHKNFNQIKKWSQNKSIYVGSPSVRWAYETYYTCLQLKKLGGGLIRRQSCMLIQAELEKVVNKKSPLDFFKKFEDVELLEIKKAKHELLHENPSIYNDVFNLIKNKITL